MKVFISGVERVKGTSKAGNAFDMCNMNTLVPTENVNNAKVNIQGHGLKSMQMNLDPAILDQFSALKFPCLVDVVCEPRPFMGKYETTVVGLAKAA
jgi:hypothetical protein